jgi:hypothetical protein
MKKLILSALILVTFTSIAQEFPNPFEENIIEFNLEDLRIIRTSLNSDEIVQEVYGYDWVAHYGGKLVMLLSRSLLHLFSRTPLLDLKPS